MKAETYEDEDRRTPRMKDVLVITDLLSLTDVLYVLYLLLLLMCLN